MKKSPSPLEILFHAPRPAIVEEWIAGLREEGLEFTPVPRAPGEGASGARVAFVWNPAPGVLDDEDRLEIVFNIGAGVDAILKDQRLAEDVLLVRLEDVGMGSRMAEYVIHALAEITRDMAHYRQAQSRNEWSRLGYAHREDWPVGVLGLGLIGSQIASTVAALGYPVRGWSRRQRHLDGVECHAGQDGLERFLAHTRVLVNVLPLTPETHHILDAQTFRQLLPGGHIINVGRGGHLNEQDLLACLEDGTLGGATLDVFATEPLPAAHAFWQHPAIRVTPHVSAQTNVRLAMQQVASKLRAWRAGTAISGVVDRRSGY